MNKLQILKDGKELIVLHGWRQRSYRGLDGALCSKGALRVAATGDVVVVLTDDPNLVPYLEAYNLMLDALEVPAVERYDDPDAYDFHLPKWNDQPERTREEVLGLFNKAILLAARPPLEECDECGGQSEHTDACSLHPDNIVG